MMEDKIELVKGKKYLITLMQKDIDGVELNVQLMDETDDDIKFKDDNDEIHTIVKSSISKISTLQDTDRFHSIDDEKRLLYHIYLNNGSFIALFGEDEISIPSLKLQNKRVYLVEEHNGRDVIMDLMQFEYDKKDVIFKGDNQEIEIPKRNILDVIPVGILEERNDEWALFNRLVYTIYTDDKMMYKIYSRPLIEYGLVQSWGSDIELEDACPIEFPNHAELSILERDGDEEYGRATAIIDKDVAVNIISLLQAFINEPGNK